MIKLTTLNCLSLSLTMIIAKRTGPILEANENNLKERIFSLSVMCFGFVSTCRQIMCVPRPIDLVVIDKKSSISFRLKLGKQSEEGSISNHPLPESNYFSQEPIPSALCTQT